MKVFSFVLLLVLIVSCGEDSIKVERKVKHKADSLFQMEYQSIIKVRKQEIIQLQKGL